LNINQFRIAYWQEWARRHDYDPKTLEFVPKPFSDEVDVFVGGE
jgi:hypothetical protein